MAQLSSETHMRRILAPKRIRICDFSVTEVVGETSAVQEFCHFLNEIKFLHQIAIGLISMVDLKKSSNRDQTNGDFFFSLQNSERIQRQPDLV